MSGPRIAPTRKIGLLIQQILVSHHLELLLPSADYVVRILDGRIDTQGTPSELRANGELDGLIAMEEAEAHKEEPVTADETVDSEVKAAEGEDESKAKKEKKPAKKFVQGPSRHSPGPVGMTLTPCRRGAPRGSCQVEDVQAVHCCRYNHHLGLYHHHAW